MVKSSCFAGAIREAHLLLLVRNPLNTWKSTPRDW